MSGAWASRNAPRPQITVSVEILRPAPCHRPRYQRLDTPYLKRIIGEAVSSGSSILGVQLFALPRDRDKLRAPRRADNRDRDTIRRNAGWSKSEYSLEIEIVWRHLDLFLSAYNFLIAFTLRVGEKKRKIVYDITIIRAWRVARNVHPVVASLVIRSSESVGDRWWRLYTPSFRPSFPRKWSQVNPPPPPPPETPLMTKLANFGQLGFQRSHHARPVFHISWSPPARLPCLMPAALTLTDRR